MHRHMYTPTQRHREILEVMGTIITLTVVTPHGFHHCIVPKYYAYVQTHQIIYIKHIQFLIKTKQNKTSKVISVLWQMTHSKSKHFRNSYEETLTLGWGHPWRFLRGRIWVGTEGCLEHDKQRRGRRAKRSDSMACVENSDGLPHRVCCREGVKVLKSHSLVMEGPEQ